MQHATLGDRRTRLTHVAFICDDPHIQGLLPQVIICNEHTVSQRQFDALLPGCPPNVYLVRQRSAWINIPLNVQIVRWLAAVLAPFMGDFQPILLFDAFKVHLNSAVLRACTRAGIWPVVVAAATTWLLQPLDTHAFGLYKCRLQKAYQTLRIRSANGRVGIVGLLEAMYVAIREVLVGRDWAHAFARNGLGTSQADVSQRVLTHLDLAPPLAAACTRPTLEQLRLCWPRRMIVPEADVWRRGAPLASAEPAVAPADAPRRSARIAALVAPAAVAPPAVAIAEPAAASADGPRRSARIAALAEPIAVAAPVVVAHRLISRRYTPPS